MKSSLSPSAPRPASLGMGDRVFLWRALRGKEPWFKALVRSAHRHERVDWASLPPPDVLGEYVGSTLGDVMARRDLSSLLALGKEGMSSLPVINFLLEKLREDLDAGRPWAETSPAFSLLEGLLEERKDAWWSLSWTMAGIRSFLPDTDHVRALLLTINPPQVSSAWAVNLDEYGYYVAGSGGGGGPSSAVSQKVDEKQEAGKALVDIVRTTLLRMELESVVPASKDEGNSAGKRARL